MTIKRFREEYLCRLHCSTGYLGHVSFQDTDYGGIDYGRVEIGERVFDRMKYRSEGGAIWFGSFSGLISALDELCELTEIRKTVSVNENMLGGDVHIWDMSELDVERKNIKVYHSQRLFSKEQSRRKWGFFMDFGRNIFECLATCDEQTYKVRWS